MRNQCKTSSRAAAGKSAHRMLLLLLLKRVACATATVVMLAGCGGSSQSQRTAAASRCLKNALANQALGDGDNCNNGMAAHILSQGSGTRITVTCTHQNTNEYICDVKVPTVEGIGRITTVRPGFYQVTFDGRSIVYQQTT